MNRAKLGEEWVALTIVMYINRPCLDGGLGSRLILIHRIKIATQQLVMEKKNVKERHSRFKYHKNLERYS